MVAVVDIWSIRVISVSFPLAIISFPDIFPSSIYATSAAISASASATYSSSPVIVRVLINFRLADIKVVVLGGPVGGDIRLEKSDTSVKVSLESRGGYDVGLDNVQAISFDTEGDMSGFCPFIHHLVSMLNYIGQYLMLR